MGISTLLHGLSTKDPEPTAPAVTGDELTKEELLAMRYQSGVNIGALFVQEKWIDSSLFKEGTDTGGSELAALRSWGDKPDLKEMKQRWEKHWKEFVTDDDLKAMQHHGITAARIPVGFFNLGDPRLLKHTEFEKYGEVYADSWQFVFGLINRLNDHGISTLLDLHALPGGANGDEHSGTSDGQAGLWEHAKYRDLAMDSYKAAAKLVQDTPHVIGLQLVNEAPYGESKCEGFYLDSAKKLRDDGFQRPIVISDGWDLGTLSKNVEKWDKKLYDKKGRTTGFIIDTHVYRTFSDEDRAKSADEHIQAADHSVEENPEVDVIVGEWSCTLDEKSWQKCKGDRGKGEAEFGRRQLMNFQNLAGNYFWTLKFGQGNGGSWDWRTMSSQGVYLNRIEPGRGDLKSSLQSALKQHSDYWKGQDSKQDWEDWRFEAGFQQGWADAEQFARFQGSRAGRIAALKAARTAQHVEKKGKSDKLFVFEQAYVQGIRARTHAN